MRSVADIAERKNMGRFDAAMPFSTVAGVMWPAPTYDEARDLGEIWARSRRDLDRLAYDEARDLGEI